ncbi:MAG: hypothetical protein ABIJ96_01990 [Elusimicrobiota bacterium]
MNFSKLLSLIAASSLVAASAQAQGGIAASVGKAASPIGAVPAAVGAGALLRSAVNPQLGGMQTFSLGSSLPGMSSLQFKSPVLPSVKFNAAVTVSGPSTVLRHVPGAKVLPGNTVASPTGMQAKPQGVRAALNKISAYPESIQLYFDGAKKQAANVVPSAEKWSNVPARKKAAVNEVSFAKGISAEHQEMFRESLTRRKAGWFRELGRMGVNLLGPVAPVLTVREIEETRGGVRFVVDWTQGPTHLGSFRATIGRDDPKPALRRLPAPMPPVEQQLTIRFNSKVIGSTPEGIHFVKEVTERDIAEYLEENGLRLLSRLGKGMYKVAVTGKAEAEAVAKEMSGLGIVHYATPATVEIPEENQFHVVFKKTRVVEFEIAVEVEVTEQEIGAALRAQGLTVLEVDRDGIYRVGGGAAALTDSALVLYASPVLAAAPDERRIVLQFADTVIVGGIIESAVGEDQIADLLRERGLTVLEDLGSRTYILAVPEGALGKDVAPALEALGMVKSAVAVGTLSDDVIKSAAQSVASYKGRPWSSTEYNMHYGMTYASLVQRGATKAQLEEYRRLCAEAPVRGGGFNPWSGD